MKTIIKIVMAVMMNCLMGATIALAAGLDPAVCMVGMNAVGMAMQGVAPSNALRAGVYTEVWTGELVKKLRAGLEATWLDGIPDQSSIVENDVIHLIDVGVDPDVLINNTTYPIPLQALDDKDIPIGLDKFQTKVTPVTDDELYAISYDKMGRVTESHGNAIADNKFLKAAHSLAPGSSWGCPIIATTGPDDGTGRRRLRREDIVALKAGFDNMLIPASGRRLVLCSDHVNDLLLLDQKFADQYYNYKSGMISNLYGFEVYTYANNPHYTTAGQKLGLKSTDGYQASFAFYVPRVFKATGSTKMYWSPAVNDPEYQRNKINFRHYFLCMPKKVDACGAIFSSAADGSATPAQTPLNVVVWGSDSAPTGTDLKTDTVYYLTEAVTDIDANDAVADTMWRWDGTDWEQFTGDLSAQATA